MRNSEKGGKDTHTCYIISYVQHWKQRREAGDECARNVTKCPKGPKDKTRDEGREVWGGIESDSGRQGRPTDGVC